MYVQCVLESNFSVVSKPSICYKFKTYEMSCLACMSFINIGLNLEANLDPLPLAAH